MTDTSQLLTTEVLNFLQICLSLTFKKQFFISLFHPLKNRFRSVQD